MNSSGPISLAGTTAGVSIEIENGGNGTTQISLNDTAVRSLAGVTTPNSTIIMPTNFYGKSNQFSFSITANTTNYVLRASALTAGWNGSSKLVCTINSGVYVYSTGTGSYAMTIAGSFPGGVALINNGTIVGKGGDGGAGNGSSGGSGGPALQVTVPVTITNGSGRIAGGGGGGGGASGTSECHGPYKGGCDFYVFIGGPQGGGGIGNGAPNGTLTAAGGATGSGAGSGGGYGSAGSAGAGSGGAGGAAVVGNSNITWVSTGTRNGSIS